MSFLIQSFSLNKTCQKIQNFSDNENFYEILVVDKTCVDYLKLVKVGRVVEVELEDGVKLDLEQNQKQEDGKSDGEAKPNTKVYITCLSQYDVYYLKDNIVVFDVDGYLEENAGIGISSVVENLITLQENISRDLSSNDYDNENTNSITSFLTKNNIKLLNKSSIINAIDNKLLKVYNHLKSKNHNYCLITGQAMGVDFLLYNDSPEKCHASHGIVVREICDFYELLMNVRNCHQVGKNLLVCFVG